MIICPIGAKRLSADCCFSELHYKNATKCVGLVRVQQLGCDYDKGNIRYEACSIIYLKCTGIAVI